MSDAKGDFEIQWVDSGREPKCPPNPDYPEGIDIPAPSGAAQRCKAKLPYPAERCGMFLIRCKRCGLTASITTAGRPDDPRSITMGCRAKEKSNVRH